MMTDHEWRAAVQALRDRVERMAIEGDIAGAAIASATLYAILPDLDRLLAEQPQEPGHMCTKCYENVARLCSDCSDAKVENTLRARGFFGTQPGFREVLSNIVEAVETEYGGTEGRSLHVKGALRLAHDALNRRIAQPPAPPADDGDKLEGETEREWLDRVAPPADPWDALAEMYKASPAEQGLRELLKKGAELMKEWMLNQLSHDDPDKLDIESDEWITAAVLLAAPPADAGLREALAKAGDAMIVAHAALELSDGEFVALEYPIDGPTRENIQVGVMTINHALKAVRAALVGQGRKP